MIDLEKQLKLTSKLTYELYERSVQGQKKVFLPYAYYALSDDELFRVLGFLEDAAKDGVGYHQVGIRIIQDEIYEILKARVILMKSMMECREDWK